jgi:hypothetical protein
MSLIRQHGSPGLHSSHLVHVLGHPISDFSRHLVRQIAREASLNTVHITSVGRSVEDQAQAMFKKHVVEGTAANYKHPAVARIIRHARKLLKDGYHKDAIICYMVNSMEHVHGGPQAISRHIGTPAYLEVFDVAHYSGKGTSRQYFMTPTQAAAFLEACRRRIPHYIAKLGHSKELGRKLVQEFDDEKCFHMEVMQPRFDISEA